MLPSCRFFDQYMNFFATFVRSSARDFSFCIHGHAGWCHWKRILWGQSCMKSHLYSQFLDCCSFCPLSCNYLWHCSSLSKIELRCYMHFLFSEMLIHYFSHRQYTSFVATSWKISTLTAIVRTDCTNFRKGWTVSCKILFLGLRLNGNPVKSESKEFKIDPQNSLAPKWIESAI